jgi:hypothetical protein
MMTGQTKTSLLLPKSAVMPVKGLNSKVWYRVAFVNDKNVVQIRSVDVQEVSRNYYRVTEGLDLEEWVIIENSGKIRDGTRVTPEKVTLSYETATPKESKSDPE